MRSRFAVSVAVCLVAACVFSALPAAAQLELSSANGKQTIKFGLLTQLRGDWLDTADGNNTSKDLYIRRLRILAGGKFGDKITYFFETDAPNLGKAAADGTKGTSDVYIQDLVVTYNHSKAFHLDTGMILIPTSHNSNQSAVSLLPVDYGSTSFVSSGPTGSRVGRDYGVQARGYLGNDHLEYRFGVFQGARGANSTMPFRTVARVVWYPFDAETGLFYSGTNFGKKHILAIGGSYDHQDNYKATAGDLYFDWPVGNGDAVTLQGDYIKYDGGTTFASIPEQSDTLFEAGYFLHNFKLSPFVQYTQQNLKVGADQTVYQGGLAYWAEGHNFNVKLGWGKIKKDNVPDRNQFEVQMQFFFF